jgi:hypothetical protein
VRVHDLGAQNGVVAGFVVVDGAQGAGDVPASALPGAGALDVAVEEGVGVRRRQGDGAAFIPADLRDAVEPVGAVAGAAMAASRAARVKGFLPLVDSPVWPEPLMIIPRVFPRGRGPPIEHRSVDRAIPLHFPEDFEGLRPVGDLIVAVDVVFHRALVAAGLVLRADVADRAVGEHAPAGQDVVNEVAALVDEFLASGFHAEVMEFHGDGDIGVDPGGVRFR